MIKCIKVLSVLILLLLSCEKSSNVKILTESAFRVKVGTPVIYKGLQVGEINDFSFFKSNVVLHAKLDDKILPLTTHYDFKLQSINLFEVGLVLTINDTINNKLDQKNGVIYCNLEFPKVKEEIRDSIVSESDKLIIDFFSKKIDSVIDKRSKNR